MLIHFKVFQTVKKSKKQTNKQTNKKTNEVWVGQESKFYNSSFKKYLKEKHIEMCSTHNEGKSVVAERFIRTLKNKIYKHMTAVSKNVYFDVLNDIVNKNNNTYHGAIKLKSIDVKPVKGNKLYVKWKGYDNSFNSWIDKNDIV